MAGDYRKHSPLLPIVYNLSVITGNLAPMHPSKSLSPSSPSLGPPHRCISLHSCIESPTGSLSLPHLPKLLQEEEKNNNNNKGKSIPRESWSCPSQRISSSKQTLSLKNCRGKTVFVSVHTRATVCLHGER